MDGAPQATGHLIEGVAGGMAKWSDVKAQAATILGIDLTDADLLDVPRCSRRPLRQLRPGCERLPAAALG